MHAGRIWRSLAGADYCKGPDVIGSQRIGTRGAVVSVLIVNLIFVDGGRALLTKLEGGVWCKGPGLEIVAVSNCTAIVKTGTYTRDVVPDANCINWLAEVCRDA